ncbi:MAG: hypothetical protein JWN34_966 [Bryobacterales bacterium]|nr:hypothetical protein [Bryobacterales bacterium]
MIESRRVTPLSALLSLTGLLIAVPLPIAAQADVPELTGTVAFRVSSASGRVERLVVTIGDGGSGRYKAVLTGDAGLPTHAIYRPRDLRPFGQRNRLPIVGFGNGGCRNTSGEFRNLLSEIASHGFLVVAIGPAGNAVVMGSEERTNTTTAAQLLDGVTWAIAENGRAGSPFYQKIDTTKVAVTGQSCGAQQAIDVSIDPRVTTTIAMSQGINMGTPGGRAANGGAGRGGVGRAGAGAADPRYAPFAPPLIRAPEDAAAAAPRADRAEVLTKLHAPILYITGGETDSGHRSASMNFAAIDNVPAAHAWQQVGHYPATYREPNGGAFAKAATAWLKWQLKGDKAARAVFAGPSCGLCSDPKWTIQRKKLD